MESDRYRELVYIIRSSSNKVEINKAFEEISEGLSPIIKKMANKYKIPGYRPEDIYQECLIALQYKAIKDYDETKGAGEGPAAFDHFAMVCIRRHLATVWKTATQNKKKILNESKSLEQNRGTDSSEEMSLVNIVPSNSASTLYRLEIREFLINFIEKLVGKKGEKKSGLSPFEQQVFLFYIKKYSYKEIAETLLGQTTREDIKKVDNGLSRIKNKGKEIAQKMISQGQAPQRAIEILNEHFEGLIVPEEDAVHAKKEQKKRRKK